MQGSPLPPFRQGGLFTAAIQPAVKTEENVAIGTVLPGMATGMIRGFPRRADDICPYGA